MDKKAGRVLGILWMVWLFVLAQPIAGPAESPDSSKPDHPEESAAEPSPSSAKEGGFSVRPEEVVEILERQYADRVAKLGEQIEERKRQKRSNRGRDYSAQTAQTIDVALAELEPALEELQAGPAYFPYLLDPFEFNLKAVGRFSTTLAEVYRVVGPTEVMVRFRERMASGFDRRFKVPRPTTKVVASPPLTVVGLPTEEMADGKQVTLGNPKDLFYVAGTTKYRSGLGKTTTTFVVVHVPWQSVENLLDSEEAPRTRRGSARSGRRGR